MSLPQRKKVAAESGASLSEEKKMGAGVWNRRNGFLSVLERTFSMGSAVETQGSKKAPGDFSEAFLFRKIRLFLNADAAFNALHLAERRELFKRAPDREFVRLVCYENNRNKIFSGAFLNNRFEAYAIF